jgi:glutaredoxin
VMALTGWQRSCPAVEACNINILISGYTCIESPCEAVFMERTVTLLLILACVFPVQPVSAEIYRWVDENGKTHISDKPPVNTEAELVKLNIKSYTDTSVSDSSVTVKDKVVMYSTSTCPYCIKAKRYFRKNNIPFEERDINKSKQARREFKELGGRGVPLILVGSKQMRGFSESGFESVYRN